MRADDQLGTVIVTWRRWSIAGAVLFVAGLVAGYLAAGDLERISWSYARGYSAGTIDAMEGNR